MSGNTRTNRTPQAVETIFVGGALEAMPDLVMENDGPVVARHMRSIDDLLHHLDDHVVECAVIDQSRQTESRGLKLALLASLKRVNHLIVLAPHGSRAEIEAIQGVHRVLRTPAAPKQILDAVFEYAGALESGDTSGAGDEAGPATSASASATTDQADLDGGGRDDADNGVLGNRGKVIGRRLAGLAASFRTVTGELRGGPGRSAWQQFLPLASFAYKKLAMIVLASLFALFLCYGAIIVFFLTSTGWSLPIELSSGHELVVRAEKDLGEMRVRENQVRQDLAAAQVALTIAERDKRDARLRLEITKRTIDLELSQQHKLLQEIREHILRLKQIIADFRNQNGRGTFARNLEQAYANRTITRKSLEAGTLAVLESLHRMALVSNELALKQIEEDRIGNRVEFLKSLKAQIDLPEIRTLTASSSDLVYLARDVISDQNLISQADKVIESKTKEVEHLGDSLAVITHNIDSLLSSPVGRAISAPVTVVFVPYENAADYAKGAPLYRCRMMIAFCSKVGVTGDPIPGESTSVHPLFGKPLRGSFVEAVLADKNDAKEELLHAGRPPLFF